MRCTVHYQAATLTALLVFSIASTLQAQPSRPDFANGVFKSAEHGLQVKLPTGWDVGASSIPGSIAVFFPPGDDAESLNLFHRDATDKDAEAIIAELQKEIRDHDANATFEPTEDVKLGGQPARQYAYTVTLGGTKKSGLMRVGIREGKAYIFMYSDVPDSFTKEIAAVKKVMDALRWTPPVKK